MEDLRDIIYKAIRHSSKEMNDQDIGTFVSGILVGLSMAEKDSLSCREVNSDLRTSWTFDPSTPSAEYGPDIMAAVVLRALPGRHGGLILPT